MTTVVVATISKNTSTGSTPSHGRVITLVTVTPIPIATTAEATP